MVSQSAAAGWRFPPTAIYSWRKSNIEWGSIIALCKKAVRISQDYILHTSWRSSVALALR